MVGCSAYGCKSRSEKKIAGITFHRFPRDPKKQRKWVQNMKLTDFTPTANDRICSNHFEETWFYQANQRTKLLNEAVPTVFLELPSYLQIKKGTKRRHSTPPPEPMPSTSIAALEDTPREKKLRKKLFLLQERSRIKSKKIKVLGQSLKRHKKKIVSLKQLVSTLEKRNFAENGILLQNLSGVHQELTKRKLGKTRVVSTETWSSAYFRCLSVNIPPPVKPRLEYPIPRDYVGITPGWLKALLYQLQNNLTISFKILWDRWTGACLEHNTLIQILCLGGFNNPDAIPWLRFIGLCAAHLTDDLTHTMILICEIMTEEPEGGSATITLETFIDLYKFLANIDASQPQILKNLYFTDSLLSLWREKDEQDDQSKEDKDEFMVEEESSKSAVTEKIEEEEVKKDESKEVISCPSIAGDVDYSLDYYVDDQGIVEGDDQVTFQDDVQEHSAEIGEEDEEKEIVEGEEDEDLEEGTPKGSEGTVEKGSEKSVEKDKKSDVVDEEEEKAEITSKKDSGEELDEAEATKSDAELLEGSPDEQVEEEQILEPTPYESVDTIQEEPRKIEPDYFEDEKTLQEDLDRLKALQQEMAGETDDELEKYKCRLIEEMPLTESQEQAAKHFTPTAVKKEEIFEEPEAEGVEEEEYEEKIIADEVFVDAIPGIGRKIPQELVTAVCDYMKSVAAIQHGMVMPRNIRHYNCPPLEVLEY